MLRRLYDWTMSLASRPMAEVWLFIISFVESSVFLVPAEVLFLPMSIANPKKVWRYALLASVGSVLGGVAGWLLGYYAFETIARPVLEFYGKADEFDAMKSSVDFNLILIFLVTSGLAHLPPMKVVTILSGALGVNLLLFTAAAVVARGGKFLILAWLLAKFGAPIRDFIEKRLKLITSVVAGVIILAYIGYLMIRH